MASIAKRLGPASMAAVLFLSGALSGCSFVKEASSRLSGHSPSTQTSPERGGAGQLKKRMDQGNAHAKARHWQAALSSFNQAIALNPDYAPAHVQAGWVCAELKQWDEARQHLLKAISLAPENAGAHANLAWVYAERQNWDDARREASKAIDLDVKNAYAHATLAWAYQQTNQEALALAEYEKSIELKPDLDNSHFALGMIYCNKGDMSRAREHLGHLKQLHSVKAGELQARVSKGCYPPKKR